MAKTNSNITIYNSSEIQKKIYTIRNEQVMIDSDLALFYDVEIRRLNEQVKRNKERFPEEFMFQLTDDEWESLRFQIVTLKDDDDSLRSQNATLEKGRGRHRKYLPYVFT